MRVDLLGLFGGPADEMAGAPVANFSTPAPVTNGAAAANGFGGAPHAGGGGGDMFGDLI